MNQELFRPFGENFSARAEDFQTSESYRWVRLGTWLLMFGYVLILPLIVSTAIIDALELEIESLFADSIFRWFLLGAVLSVFAGVLLIVTGYILLRFSPAENERQAANKFLIAYGITFVIWVPSMFFDLNQLYFVQRIAAAYGTFYLLAYFQVLAANRDNAKLIWWSNFSNVLFLVVIFGGIGARVLAKMQQVPEIVWLVIFGIAFVVMSFAWITTLWHALQATRPAAKDFEPK